MLRPRGHLKKESLEFYVQEFFERKFDSWTDKSYKDKLDPYLC